MTRINAAIQPEELPYKLLLAELREIKRIPNSIHKANLNNIPNQFSLGHGHVRFFYNKGAYTLKRYLNLRDEALKRGYRVQDFSDAWNSYPKKLMGEWSPGEKERKIIIKRIKERGFVLQ